MQIINTWPEAINLALPELVKIGLIKHLTDAFQDKEEAKSYWQEHQPILIILEQHEAQTISTSLKLLDDVLQHQIERALEYPEYIDGLTDNYTIQLGILSDAGEGLYCVLPKRQIK